jgi:threonyl-tRNA synthetase
MNNKKQMDELDHRILGKKLKLFLFDDATPGMPFWLEAGAQLRKKLENVIYTAHKKRNYKPVLTPAMMDEDMWKISGHYENYKENMFPSEVEKRNYLLKPMNCPGHVLIYKSDVVSYKQLPLRMFEFGQVHRNENNGSLHGLFRVREFTQDDAHIFCSEEQIKDEIVEVLNFIDDFLKTFEFSYNVEFSTRPKKSIGDTIVWEKSENAIKEALEDKNVSYTINEGDGAFYGPKIDIKITDNHNREWQLGTVQIDFNLPERFGLEYTTEDGSFKQPVMIHRAIMGSFERFIGILLEHKKGLLPTWLSPYQLAFIPVSVESEKQMNFCKKMSVELNSELGIDSRIYDNNETFNRRIKTAELEKNPIIVIIGDKEVNNLSFSLRHKNKLKRYEISITDFIEELKTEIDINI